MAMLLWVAVPYAAIATFIVGHWWRYRYQKYTWTTRSTQILERRMLMWGILLFHFGMLAVVGGHIGGLLVPSAVTEFFGITEHMYHIVAVTMGTIAGLTMTTGLLILLLRRFTNDRVKATSIGRDYLTALMLVIVIGTGMFNTIGVNLLGESYNYRETISPWFRGILTLNPQPELMVDAPPSFKMHALAAMALFALWPFTRLVHAWSVPLTYLRRSFIVYRAK
ncbi:MAG: respiratory nitrate reductase subunit gamma [Thermoleophilia bacterium]|nr:respiratory nitrate reductase subunit gamma [Thermoleophilia bacterium]